MEAFGQRTRFLYNPNANSEGESEVSGILEIFIHHARNIHNICIYDNQDVYAKFSLTYNPDETLSTRIVNRGGKNPDFNEKLVMKVTQFDALLKCEMWVLSRAKSYMEDQLLGFALVPISLALGKEKITQDFSLSSTDLFHSPAGTVKLSLSLNTNVPLNSFPQPATNSSITSEVLLLDRKISQVQLDPVEYSRIEFPDINAANEDQQMVTEYFKVSRSFLCLGNPADDYEMAANSSEDNGGRSFSVSPNGSIQNSGFMSSTMTSLSDDRNSGDSMDKKNHLVGDLSNSLNPSSRSPETPTSREVGEVRDEKGPNSSGKDDEGVSSNKETNTGTIKYGQAFSAPLGNIEAEQSVMQQQIVDMYMRSMQQFTESLGKMKLPMDLDKREDKDHSGDVIQKRNGKGEGEKKKDGSRVFYGSRAFF